MKEKASVTVYFSLIIMILLAVIMTTVESARLAGIRVRCQSAAALGLESLFADYAAPLFEEYGLLFLEGSYGTGEKEAYLKHYQDYVSYNADCNDGRIFLGSDFYRTKLVKTEADDVIFATDKEGKALEEQICEMVIEDIPLNFLEEVLGRLELSNQCKLLTKFFDGINRMSDKVSKVDKAVQKIYEKVEELKNQKEELEGEIEELRSLIEQLDQAWKLYENAETEEEEEAAKNKIQRCKKSIESLRTRVLREQEEMQDAAKVAVEQEEIYKEKTKEVAEKLTKLRKELLEEPKEEVRKEIAETIEKQTADLRRFSGGEGDIYQVEMAEGSLRSCKEVLRKGILAVRSAGSDGSQLLSALERQSDDLRGCGISQVEILFDNHYQGESDNGVMKMIKELFDQGVVNFVMEGKEISSAVLDKEELPSLEYGTETNTFEIFKDLLNTKNRIEELLKAGKNTLLTDEYVLQHFADVTEEQSHVLKYEAEYVLCGNLSDKKNLEETIQQIVLLRTGMNLIYLLSDTESCSQAQALAMGIVGFTGMMGLVRVTQLLLLAAWSYGEALLDARCLVNGGKVAFLKSKTDWKTKLTNLKNLTQMGKTVTKDTGGLAYRDYMHILMIKERQSGKLYRIMDLLQANIRKNGWEGFRMDWCICAMKMTSDFLAEVLFLNINPFAYLKGEISGYSVQTVHVEAY